MFSIFVLGEDTKKKEIVKKQPLLSPFSISSTWKNGFDADSFQDTNNFGWQLPYITALRSPDRINNLYAIFSVNLVFSKILQIHVHLCVFMIRNRHLIDYHLLRAYSEGLCNTDNMFYTKESMSKNGNIVN